MKLPWSRQKPAPEIRLPLPWSNLTLDAWRASNVRVQFATKLMASRMGQDMLAVLQNTMPVPDISDATRAGLEGARVRGYMQAVAVLLQMQVPLPVQMPMPEPTYESTVDETILDETG